MSTTRSRPSAELYMDFDEAMMKIEALFNAIDYLAPSGCASDTIASLASLGYAITRDQVTVTHEQAREEREEERKRRTKTASDGAV